MMKIIQIGPYPPPYGGVSTHIKRLTEFLASQDTDYLLIDITNGTKNVKNRVFCRGRYLPFFLLRQRRSIIHFHIFSFPIIIVIWIILWKHIVIYSFHNERFHHDIEKLGKIRAWLIKFILKRTHCLIVSNKNCIPMAVNLGIPAQKVHSIPPFIPPVHIPELSHPEILRLRSTHQYLIASNAFQITFHQGQDLYGIDLLIELIHILHQKSINVGCCFLLPNIKDQDYFHELNRRIDQYQIRDHFLFITEPLEEGTSLWMISDIVVRPTNTDGNAMTIWEALSSGIPVIASDCVIRPEGTILFKNRDLNDLVRVTEAVIERLQEYKERSKKYSNQFNFGYDYLNIYKSEWKKHFRQDNNLNETGK